MKTSKRIIALLMALTMSLIMFSSTVWASEEDLPADGSDSSISVVEENPITVSLSENTLTLFTGKSATLKATVQPEGEHTIRWSSDNKKVATVDSKGKVIAKGAGRCTITATVDDVRATCAVTVKKPTIKLNKTSLSLDVKKRATLKATVDGPSKKVTWKSSNTKIATVDKNGKVTAKKAGKSTITATANGVSAKCKVKVPSEKDKAIEAYKKFLSQDNIYWLEIDYISSSDCYFNLIYLDNDTIPELVVQGTLASLPYTALYAYKDGKMKLVTTADNYSYYPQKGVFVGQIQDNGGKYGRDYYSYSKGTAKHKLRFYHVEDYWYTSNSKGINKNYYYKYKNNKQTEITKKAYDKALKKMVGTTKKTDGRHKNTAANRRKYLK